MRPAEQADLKWVMASRAYAGEDVDEFMAEFERHVASYQEMVILEDYNGKFGDGYGPVGMVGAITNGYLYEPHVDWFSWATPKNKIRTAVMFFQKNRWRGIGVIRVHALQAATAFYRRLAKYVPLYYVGKIPGGDALGRGDDFIFYMKCRGPKP